MTIRVFILALLCLISGCSGSFGEAISGLGEGRDRYGLSENETDTLAKYLNHIPNETEIAFAMITPEKVRYFGVKRMNDTLVYMENKASVFEIGSISKIFTCTLFAKRVYEGTLGLNDLLTDKFDFELNEGKEITLAQLANHSSGLPRMPGNMLKYVLFHWNDPYSTYTQEDLLSFMENKMELETVPGEKYAYSNLGMALLGLVVTELEGKEYETLLQEEIFGPLNMTHSTTLLEKVDPNLLVPPRNEKGKKGHNWNFDVFAPAGAIKSSVGDLVQYAQKHLTDSTYYALTHQKTFDAGKRYDLGLGWHLPKTASPDFLFHNGGTAGYKSSMVLDKKSNCGVIALTNISGTGTEGRRIDKLTLNLTKTLAGIQ